VTSNARCPNANDGSIPIPYRPGSLSLTTFRCDCRRSSSVVHCCHCQPPYCRSSVQILHSSGGRPVSANCVPQVVQMKFDIVVWFFNRPCRLRHRIAQKQFLRDPSALRPMPDHRMKAACLGQALPCEPPVR